MPVFRPGKPWRRFTLATDKQVNPGHAPIVWDLAEGDPDPAGETPADRCTVEKAGLYQLSYGVGRPIVASTGTVFTTLRVNNVQKAGQNAPSTAGSVQLSGATLLQLDEGDYVQVYASLHPSLIVPFDSRLTFLALARIGPVRWT